jgi:hypothetical protein
MVRGSCTGLARVGYPFEKYSQYFAVALNPSKHYSACSKVLNHTLSRQSDIRSKTLRLPSRLLYGPSSYRPYQSGRQGIGYMRCPQIRLHLLRIQDPCHELQEHSVPGGWSSTTRYAYQ